MAGKPPVKSGRYHEYSCRILLGGFLQSHRTYDIARNQGSITTRNGN
eukprot:COSAG02_NODE_24840_length_676_cov_0.996534_1_plen_46_part_10